jgi:hypothetical protein
MDSYGYGRSGIMGGSSGTTESAALANAASLASKYSGYLVNGFQGTNLQGQAVTFPPYLAAAALVGMEAGQPLNQALHLEAVTTTGLEQTFASPVVDNLIQGGCIVLKPYNGAFVVAKGQTTAALNPAATQDQIQLSAVNEQFVVEYGANAVLATFINKPIRPTTAASVQAAYFAYLLKQGPTGRGYIFEVPKITNIVVNITGTVISFTAPASPTLPCDFVTGLLTASVDTAQAA